MAGVGTISVNQTPQYGDRKALDKLKTGLTSTPMSGVPTPAPTAGRPPGSTTAPQQGQPQGGQVPADVDPSHKQLFSKLARSMKTAQILAQEAQIPEAGPYTRFYAQVAQSQYQELAGKTRADTPFFREG